MNTQTQPPIEKHIVVFTVPNNQILDVTGPLEVFSQADRWLRDNGWIEGLEESELSMEEIATETGLGCGETMRRAFRRQLSVSPEDYRQRFRWHRSATLRQASGA